MNSSQALSHNRISAGYRCPHLVGELVECGPGGGGVDGGVDRLEVAPQRVPVRWGGEPEGVADQVDDAGLHDGRRPHVADDVGQAFEAVADHEEDVAAHPGCAGRSAPLTRTSRPLRRRRPTTRGCRVPRPG